MNALPVLHERPGPEGVAALERAWEAPATFAFVPEKHGLAAGWLEAALSRLPEDLREDHFALLTSGSTGAPKLVVGERLRAEALARLLHVEQASEGVAEAIATLPLTYCYSFVNQWLWARVHGRRLVPTQGFARPDALRTALEAARDAMLCLVAPQVQLLERHFPGAVFPGVTRVHFAGGPFPAASIEALLARFPGARLFNNYGCAEAMPRLTVRPVAASEAGTLRSGDAGRALPGVELRVDEEGALAFRSPYAAVACCEGERCELLGPQDWILTGDRAELDAEGRLALHGRRDQVFKRYGEKVSLARLLDSLAELLPGEAAFYREPDRMGEEGAVLVLAPAPAEGEVRAILKHLRAHHPRTHWPLRIESAEHLPTLPNGKIDRNALASLAGKTVHWKNRL